MKMLKLASLAFAISLLTGCACINEKQCDRKNEKTLKTNQVWSHKKAQAWGEKQNWIIGCNFLPSNAINQLEMWQKDTFSPKVIDKELGYAESIGFNTLRVYLHDIPYFQDKTGFITRIDKFLDICAKHNMKVMFVFFDDCWHPYPKAGKQPEPIKGIHNSGWVQSPGIEILADSKKCDKLKPYVIDILEKYKNDKRVLLWDLYNEPTNRNIASYDKIELKNKGKYSLDLLKKVFMWAREVNLSQPVTSCYWNGFGGGLGDFLKTHIDVISFHNYSNAAKIIKDIKYLKQFNRPIICSEYMARPESTFLTITPILKRENIGAINWGLVSGKSGTIYPWKSWKKAFTKEADPWFHDIFRANGTPYSQKEINLLKKLTGKK